MFISHRKFSEWRETAELCNSQCQHNRQPLTLSTKNNVNTVRTLIEEDRSLTYREMVAIIDCSNSMIENMKMSCVASTWVPHHLMKQQLKKCVDVCAYLKTNFKVIHQSCPVTSHVMKPELILTTLKQSKEMQPGECCKIHQAKSVSKVMFIIFFFLTNVELFIDM